VNAVVVYESLWGNTEAVARAIAEGLGAQTRVLSTAEASAEDVAGADLLVVGAPVFGFNLPSDGMVKSIRDNPTHAKNPPDTLQPSMKSWLEGLSSGSGRSAAFETRIWWSPGGAVKGIDKALRAVGFEQAAKPERFIVEGQYGPLRTGELERARAWGEQLSAASTS